MNSTRAAMMSLAVLSSLLLRHRSDSFLLLLVPGASLLANGQLNGSGSKNGHKEDGSLRSQGLDGGKYCEDGPAKKR